MSEMISDAETQQNSIMPDLDFEDDGVVVAGGKTDPDQSDSDSSRDEDASCVSVVQEVRVSPTEFEDSLDTVDLQCESFDDISPDGNGGIRKRIVRPGVGTEKPNYGDKVTIKYSSWEVVKGESFKRGGHSHRYEFILGRGNVNKALEVAVYTMTTGEIARCVVLSSFPFADQSLRIPPDTLWIFDVTLNGFHKEDLSPKKDKGLLRKYLIKPTGTISPNDGAFVKMHITGFYKEKIFDDREMEFIIGEGCLYNIPEGIEIALLKFKLNEKSRLFIAHQYAFGSEGKPDCDIPPLADVEYDVNLLHVIRAVEVWEMNTDDKWKYSVEAKEKGNTFFKGGHIKAALKQYRRVVKYLENEPGVRPTEIECRMDLLVAVYLNIALCLLKLGSDMDAVKACDKVVAIDPVNEKGLFRRGQGYFNVNDFESALLDFKKVVINNPANTSARKYVTDCKSQILIQHEKEHNTYGNMFRRFAEKDEERRKQQQCQTETGVWGGHDRAGAGNNSPISDEDAIVQMLNQQNLCMD